MAAIKDLDTLSKLKVEMESFFSDLHKEIEADEDYYNLDFQEMLDMPDEFEGEATVLPTARSNVDSIVDHVSPEARSVEVAALSDKRTAQEAARKQQRFYESLLNWVEDSFDQSPFRQGVKRLGGIGIETWKFIPLPGQGRPRQKSGESDEDYEERVEQWKIDHQTTMPFRLIPLHPTEVFFDPFNPTPKWGIHSKTMYVGDAEEVYPTWGNPKNRRITDTVDVIEYWDNEWRAVLIDGLSGLGDGKELVRHRWGTHPFIVGGSGFGIDDREHGPENKYVSINRFIRNVLHSQSRNYSVIDTVLKASAWPIRVATGDRANDIPNMELKYGHVYPFPAGVKIEDLNPQLPSGMVGEHMALASSILSEYAAPRAVRGLREPGTTSGIDQQTQLGEARLKYRPIAIGIERMMTQICQKAAIYMRTTINHPVNIGAGARTDEVFEISGTSFARALPVRVRVNVLDPSDEIRKKNAVAQELAAGTIDQLQAIKELHPDMDATKIQRRVWSDRLMNNPIVQQVLGAAIAEGLTQKMELEDLLASAIARVSATEGTGVDPSTGGRTPPAETPDGGQPGDRADSARNRMAEGRL